MRTLASLFIGLVAGSLFILLLYLILRPKGPKTVSLVLEGVGSTEEPPSGSPTAADNLESIIGIGPAYARRLNGAGINTFADLAATSPDRVAEIIGSRARPADIDSWIAQAQGLS